MKPETLPKPCNPVPFEHILGSAVILNWEAFGLLPARGTVRVEYHVGREGAVEYLKLWANAGNYWSLICDYAPHVGWSDGPRFSNGFHSRQLGRLLQSILMNQKLFTHGRAASSTGTLEVRTPTMEDITNATLQVGEAFPPPVPSAPRVHTSKLAIASAAILPI